MIERIKETHQYALIAFLIKQSARAKHSLSKQLLQRKVHFIQELGGVKTGYRFTLYNYGPHSAALGGDLNVIEHWGGAEVTYRRSDNRYQINPSARTD